MALTKVDKSVSSTPGIVDSSNATAITIDSSENVLIGATSGSDPLVVSDSGASSITARFINTNADANPANIRLQKLSGSPADDDYIGMINVSGENDASEETIFQSIDFISTDVSDGTEDGVIAFRTRGAGTLAERLRITEQGFIKLPSKVAFSGTGDAGLGHHTNNYMYIYGGTAGLILQDNSGGSNRVLLRDTNTIEFETNGSARMSLDSTGNLVVSGNVTAYGSPSDIRLKENVEVIDNAVDKVKQLKGITYDLKSDGNRLTGLIAQDLEKVLPEAVYTAKDLETEEEHLAIRYGNTVGLLVEAIKEQQEQIEVLTAKVKELEAK